MSIATQRVVLPSGTVPADLDHPSRRPPIIARHLECLERKQAAKPLALPLFGNGEALCRSDWNGFNDLTASQLQIARSKDAAAKRSATGKMGMIILADLGDPDQRSRIIVVRQRV